jgi:hypothetical protein
LLTCLLLQWLLMLLRLKLLLLLLLMRWAVDTASCTFACAWVRNILNTFLFLVNMQLMKLSIFYTTAILIVVFEWKLVNTNFYSF